MKGPLTPLSVLVLAVSASALSLDVPLARAALEPPALDAKPSFDPERELAKLEREEAAAQLELRNLSAESELLKARTLARGRAYARLARAGLLPLGGGFHALVEHAVRMERLYRSLSRDVAQERQVAARRAQLAKQLTAISLRRGPLAAEQRTLAQAQIALLAARDRDQAFERAFMGGDLDDHTAVYGAPADGVSTSSSGFAALKGSLPFPLAGRSEIRPARRNAGGPGLTLLAPSGASVRAVFPGRVAFADSYADYGRTVILDHGGGYYTVSANLAEIEVKVGDELKGGGRLGTLAQSSSGSTLYFEVRIGRETVDAAGWFGI